jgi:hypothetical protein
LNKGYYTAFIFSLLFIGMSFQNMYRRRLGADAFFISLAMAFQPAVN